LKTPRLYGKSGDTRVTKVTFENRPLCISNQAATAGVDATELERLEKMLAKYKEILKMQ
jgi:hypothetical protein